MNNGTDVERARFLSLPLSALRSPFHRLFPSLLHFSFYSSTFTSVHHFSFSVRSCFPFYLISLSYLALPFMFSLFSLLSFSAGWCYRLNVPLLLDIWWRNAKLKADEGKDASIVVNLFVVCPFLIRRSACCCSLYCCQSDLSNETLRKLLSVWYLCVTRDEISRKRTYIPKLCFYYLFLFPISYIFIYIYKLVNSEFTIPKFVRIESAATQFCSIFILCILLIWQHIYTVTFAFYVSSTLWIFIQYFVHLSHSAEFVSFYCNIFSKF